MSADELREAAAGRRSVIIPGFNRNLDRGTAGPERPLPAIFVLNMQWSLVEKRLPSMKLYERPQKAERFRT